MLAGLALAELAKARAYPAIKLQREDVIVLNIYRNKVLKSPTNKNNLLSSQLGQPYRLAQLAVLGLPLD